MNARLNPNWRGINRCAMAEQDKDNPTIQILVVEDSPTQAEKLAHILREKGYNVHCAKSGKEAMEVLDKKPFTLVISDILMPEMDGFQLCSLIKKTKEFNHLPIMLLTALSGPHDIIQGLECGADNFIIKPYKESYLISQVEYMLANAKLRDMAFKRNSQLPDMGVEIFFAGKKHYIMSSQLQILDLLFSTFEVYAQKNRELEEKNKELTEMYERINALNGLIPICANCKKIRDDKGYWQQVDEYLTSHSHAGFDHAVCPECASKGS